MNMGQWDMSGPYQGDVQLCYGCRQPGHQIRECPSGMLLCRLTPPNLLTPSISGTSQGGRGQYIRQSEAQQLHSAMYSKWHARPCQEEIRLCYGCRQPGHLIRECPNASDRATPLLRLPTPLIGGTSQGGRGDGSFGQRGRRRGCKGRTIVGSCHEEVRLCHGCKQPGHLIAKCSRNMLPSRAALRLCAPPIADTDQGGRRDGGLRGQGRGSRGQNIDDQGQSVIDEGSRLVSRGSGSVGGLAKVCVLTSKDAQTFNEVIADHVFPMGKSLSGSNDSAHHNDDVSGRRPWSDLPALVLYKITMRLTSPFALAAFAGVCSLWRSVAKSAKSDFITSQPPLHLTLPPPSSRRPSYSLYSLIEGRSYSVESLLPAKFWQPTSASFIKFSYLGYSHGCLIMISSSAEITSVQPFNKYSFCTPSLLSPLTGKRIDLNHFVVCNGVFSGGLPTAPVCNGGFSRGLLTAPVTCADSKLMLFDKGNMHCWRISDSNWYYYKFELGGCINGAVIHKGRLYLIDVLCRVWLMDADHPHEVLQFIQPPSCVICLPHLVVLDGELLMMSSYYPSYETGVQKPVSRMDAYRLDLSRGESEARWMRRTSGSGPLFIDCFGNGVYLGSKRMKGVEESYVYCSRCVYDYIYSVHTNNNYDNFFVVNKPSPNGGTYGVWVHPSDLQQWGFSF